MDVPAENELERLLKLAAAEPAHRPEFYRALLDSTVFVLGSAGDGEGTVQIEAGQTVGIQSWEQPDGTPIIPFFSSLETLQQSIEEEQSYLALPAKAFFEMTQGSMLFLNPRSSYGKEFLPDEIEHMLSSGVGSERIRRTVPAGTKLLLGQPAEYPKKMVDSLRQLLAKHSNVLRAYLALMHDPSQDKMPHLVIGIEAEGDIDRVMYEAGQVAGDSVPDGEVVDLVQVIGDDSVSGYMKNETTPFYERKPSKSWKSLFGFGKQ